MALPPEHLPPGTEAAFEGLRQIFRAGLAHRWAEIAGAATAEDLGAALHRLAGAAGSYAFAEIDVAARHALQVVERRAEKNVIHAALEGLQRRLRQAGATV